MSEKGQMIFNVEGMKCEGCVSNVSKALNTLVGVDSCYVDLDKGQAIVNGPVSEKTVVDAIKEAGYAAKLCE